MHRPQIKVGWKGRGHKPLPRPGQPSVTHLGLWGLGNLGPLTRAHEVKVLGWLDSLYPPIPTLCSQTLFLAYPRPLPTVSWAGKLGSLLGLS